MSAPLGWEDGIRKVDTEGAGAFDIHVLARPLPHDLMLAALSGDAVAVGLLQAVASTVDSIGKAPRKKPALCLCCPRAVRKADQYVVCITTPHRDDPSMAIGSVICAKCWADQERISERIIEAMRAVWPDARPLDHMHDAPRGVQ